MRNASPFWRHRLPVAAALLAVAMLACSASDECDADFGSDCDGEALRTCKRRDCSHSYFGCSETTYLATASCGSGNRCMVEGARRAACLPNATDLSCAVTASSPLTPGPEELSSPSVGVADFDRDGVLDVAVWDAAVGGSRDAGGAVRILLGNGDGTFRAGAALPTPGAVVAFHGSGASITVGDFDGDHRADVAWLTPSSLQIALGLGDGSFQPPIASPSDNVAATILAADLNGDGRDDVVAVGRPPLVFLSDAKGKLTAGASNATHEREYVTSLGATVADLDGDGHLDVAAIDMFGDTGLFYRGRGDGSFDAPRSFATAQLPSAVIAADIDNDGHPDLVTGHFSVSLLQVHHGRGDGTFDAGVPFSALSSPAWLGAADLDGDGTRDLVVGTENRHVFSVFHGKRDGTFGDGVAFDPTRENAIPVAMADFDRDGRIDLLLTGPGKLTVVPRACH